MTVEDRLVTLWDGNTHVEESNIFSFTKYAVRACVDRSKNDAMTERTSSCSDPNIGNHLTRLTLPLDHAVSFMDAYTTHKEYTHKESRNAAYTKHSGRPGASCRLLGGR